MSAICEGGRHVLGEDRGESGRCQCTKIAFTTTTLSKAPAPEGFKVRLTDQGGGVTDVPIKKGRPVNIPHAVLFGGTMYKLEHSGLHRSAGSPDQWVGHYREAPVFSVEFEDWLPRLHDPEEAQEMIAEGISAALRLANVCTNCGQHTSSCDAQSADPYAKPCCPHCAHEKWIRCGHVAKAERGIPDGYVCMRPAAHEGYHGRGGAAWPRRDGDACPGEAELLKPPKVTAADIFQFFEAGQPPDVAPPMPGEPVKCEHATTHQIDGGDLVCNDCGANLYTEHMVEAHPNLGELVQKLEQRAGPVCATCNDTHRMELNERTVPCTACPTPCERCRFEGTGAYCQQVPCDCACHQVRRG